MITVVWRGYAVSENERHAVRRIRKTDERTGADYDSPAIKSKREYQAFVRNLAYAIMGETRRQAGVKRFQSLSVIVQLCIGPDVDGQNLFKPICDAVERSGVLTNDRNLRHRSLLPDERHPAGEVDTLHIMLYELVEASA